MPSRLAQMLSHGLRLRCPRCGVGRLYRRAFRMYSDCPHCALKFEREQGYFIGAMYINYGATVAIAIPGFFLLDAFTGMTIEHQLSLWIPFAIAFPLAFFHHARSLWLVLDYFFNPPQNLYGLPPKNSAN